MSGAQSHLLAVRLSMECCADGFHDMPQGARREVAHLMATFWAGFYDLHGKANPADGVAATLDRLGTQMQLFPGVEQQREILQSLRAQGPVHPIIAQVGQVLCTVASVAGGDGLLQTHSEGQLLMTDQIVAEIWYATR